MRQGKFIDVEGDPMKEWPLTEAVDAVPPTEIIQQAPDQAEAVRKLQLKYPPESNMAHPLEIKRATDLTSHIGNPDYYVARHKDYMARYPWKTTSPYYLDYGNKYLRKFLNDAYPKMKTDKGKKWVKETARLLEWYLEQGLSEDKNQTDKRKFKEFDDKEFKAFAFSTHSKAYLEAGFNELTPDDVAVIATTLDKDDVNIETINEMRKILIPYLGKCWDNNCWSTPISLIKQFLEKHKGN